MVAGKKGKRTYSLTKLSDTIVVLWILASKLVAREAEHDETLLCVLLVQVLEFSELRSVATFRGGVYDQRDFALQLLKVILLLTGLCRFQLEKCDHVDGGEAWEMGENGGRDGIPTVTGGRIRRSFATG